MTKLAGILIVVCAFTGLSLYAQPSAPMATQEQQNFQQNMEVQKPEISLHPGTNAPEIYEGENSDIGEQHMLRIIPRRTHFLVSLDSQYLYTDNALLSQHPYVSSTEFVNTLVAAFAPVAYRVGPGRLAPQFGYMGQWYDYGLGGNSKLADGVTPISTIDFNVQSVFAGAKYYFPNNWIAFGQANYNWFFSQDNLGNGPMFYQEFVPGAGIEHLTQVGDDAVFVAAASGDWHQSWQINHPRNQQNRADGLVSLSFAWQVMPKLIVQPYYRFQYSYYPMDSSTGPVRDDFLNSFGVSTAWFFTPDLSLRVFIDDNAMQIEGDNNAPEYHSWNTGVDLSYNFRF
ncbi:MAG TPA: hypothetical protein VGN23_11450 [Verrucomicrobiae bacterium]